MYSEKAKNQRKCLGKRKNGQPCRAWALWNDSRQLCISHAGRHHRGPLNPNRRWQSWSKTRYKPCYCKAYNWPHRPGGGLCRWPDPPTYRLTTPVSTHSRPRYRGKMREIFQILKRKYR